VRSLAFQALGPALAGPGTVVRGLAAQRTLDGGHPEEDHLFVWMLGVDPAVQRGGVGRALLGAALELADRFEVVAHLDTGNAANLPYYAGFGFRVEGEATLPRATPVWFMRRPCL
jgi:GNAT superfamily N-acetyltransferase